MLQNAVCDMRYLRFQLAPVYGLLLFVLSALLASIAHGELGTHTSQVPIMVGLGAAAGPPLLGDRRWRGWASVVVPLVSTCAACAVAVGVLYAGGLSISADWALPGVVGLSIGASLTTLLADRGCCVQCTRKVRLWESQSACCSHPSDGSTAVFHAACLAAIDERVFSSHDIKDLESLIQISRGLAPREWHPGTEPRRYCRNCLKVRAIEALHNHCWHSDFLVELQQVRARTESCTHCNERAPRSPEDGELIQLPLPGQTDSFQGVEIHKLGPLIHCPHCPAMAHLACWFSNGGCANHGGPAPDGKLCSMGGRPRTPLIFVERGWPRLCRSHAEQTGWKLPEGQPHLDVPPPAPIKHNGGPGPRIAQER